MLTLRAILHSNAIGLRVEQQHFLLLLFDVRFQENHDKKQMFKKNKLSAPRVYLTICKSVLYPHFMALFLLGIKQSFGRPLFCTLRSLNEQ